MHAVVNKIDGKNGGLAFELAKKTTRYNCDKLCNALRQLDRFLVGFDRNLGVILLAASITSFQTPRRVADAEARAYLRPWK